MVDQGYFFSPALAAAELAALLTDAGLRRGPDSVEDRERAAWNMQLVGSEVATHDDPT